VTKIESAIAAWRQEEGLVLEVDDETLSDERPHKPLFAFRGATG
jgi:hypothetical protein